MDNTKTISYKSVAQLAHERGKKVGIITSVSLDHATPAAYYASVSSRGNYNNIATQMANTGYEFFGGGGLLKPEGAASPDTKDRRKSIGINRPEASHYKVKPLAKSARDGKVFVALTPERRPQRELQLSRPPTDF